MEAMIKNNEFLEYAMVHGNYYGTSIESVKNVIQQNKTCILDIDIQGVQQVMKQSKFEQVNYILIKPPSIDDLSKRLHCRNTDSEESIQLRLQKSKMELDIAKTLPFTHIIINESIETAYKELLNCLGLLAVCFSNTNLSFEYYTLFYNYC